MLTTIHCALNWREDKCYFFANSRYLRYDLHHNMVDPGYPRAAGNKGFFGVPTTGIEAAFCRSKKVAYFFMGTKYLRYDRETNKVAPGYPKDISAKWSGMPNSSIDAAAYRDGARKVYFFKGDRYYRYNFDTSKVDPGYPKKIADHWEGVVWTNIEAVLTGQKKSGGITHKYYYFFKGGQYLRYNSSTHKVDPGYPKKLGPNLWRGVMADTWPKNRAQNALEDFQNSTAKGKWPELSKSAVQNDVKERVKNPYLIKQGATPLCGPAAIVFELVHKHPVRYVKFCQDLYEKGYFRDLAGDKVAASDKLKASKLKSGISTVDWMLLATMRESENATLKIDADSKNLAMGITTSREMKKWAKSILGFSDVDFTNTKVYGELDAIRKAHKARDKKGVGFLKIHSDMVKNKSPRIGYANHWVSYMDSLDIDERSGWDNGTVQFYCYTWGSRVKVKIEEGPFEDAFYGVVTGK